MEKEENTNIFLKQYNLSDLFDGTFKMLKYTWKNTLIICGICIIPLFLLNFVWLSRYFDFFSGFLESLKANSESFDYKNLSDLTEIFRLLKPAFNMMGIGFIIGILTMLVSFFIRGVVTLNTFKAAHGEQVTLKELALTVLKAKLGKLVLQAILLSLIIIGIFIAGIIAIGILGGISFVINKGLGVFVIFVAYLALICFAVWLGNSLRFIQEDIIYADTGVAASFKKSFHLVKGNWWRVFGMLLVFGLALSFSLSLITSPIVFSFMIPYYSKLLESLLDSGGSFNDLYPALLSMYSKIIIPISITSLISTIVSYLVSPVFSSLFYIDLKVRKNEITAGPEETPGEAVTTEGLEEEKETLEGDQ